MRRKKFFIGGLIILIAIAYLGYTGFQSAATYYYTVSELIGQGGSLYGENVRVDGEVAPGSVEQGADALLLRFTIVEGVESLPVVYQGVIPDSFKVGNEVVIEGHLDSDGIFQANTILTKCPSKYVPIPK